jgi:Ca2+-binding RTX toxin-like protein
LGISAAAPGPFGLVAGLAGAIALAPVYKLVGSISNDAGEFLLRTKFDLDRTGDALPDATDEEVLQRSDMLGAALEVPDPRRSGSRLAAVAQLAHDDVEGFAQAMAGDANDWYADTAEYLAQRADALGEQAMLGTALSEFWTYSRQAAETDPVLLASVNDQARQFASDWSTAIAGASSDRIAATASPLAITGLDTYAKKRQFWDGALAGLENLLDLFVGSAHAEEYRALVSERLDIAVEGIQSVAIRQGHAPNPFDSPTFDPDASPLSLGSLSEGSVRSFTLYLPYEAGAGGQRVKLTLAGGAADKLALLDHADEVALGADGAFMLVVPEGRRELSFGLWAKEDVDAGAALQLSAQLVDAEDAPTHFEHIELNLALEGVLETPPVTGREIRGDWAPKPYVDPATGKTTYKTDDLFNIERLPGVPSTGDVELDQWLDGSAGADHIVTGDFDEQARGGGGDDFIVGSDNTANILIGGGGADRIEGGGWANHAAEYWEWEYLGRPMGLGDDKIYGGAGDDQIWGESEATQAALTDGGEAPTGMTGDWLTGGSGADRIYGSAGDDVLLGGTGADLLVGGPGMDVLLGDDDYQIRPEGNYWHVVHPNFGDATPGFGGFELGLFPVVNATDATPEQIWALSGDPYFAYYKFGGSDDVLIGGAGRDILIGQFGDDTLYGGADDDILAGWEGADELIGGAGDDLMAGDFGRYEQTNQRWLAASMLAPAGVIGTSAAWGSAPQLVGNDLLDGGAGNDVLYGEGGDDSLLGGDGNDTLYGDAPYLPGNLHGTDVLDGGDGNDMLYAGAGDDTLYGGAGDDQLFGESGNDLLDGGPGSDWLEGGGGDDRLRAGDGDDVLFGGYDDDELRAGAGDDALYGDEGNDALYGAGGADLLDGGDGDDLIVGGRGDDVLYGGAGDDTYLFELGDGWDEIEDLEGANRIRFGAGVLAEDVRAQLDGGTLLATLTYSRLGDAISFEAGVVEFASIEFADGSIWTPKQLADALPALVVAGTSASETLEGRSGLRNALLGGGGDDTLLGGVYDDFLYGEDGEDFADGHEGSDIYFFAGTESGVDRIEDSGADDAARDVLRFGPGVTLAGLALRVTVPAASADAHPDMPWQDGGALSARWTGGGFDLAVPASGGAGEGVEAFEFDDGSAYSLSEVLAQASVLALAGEYRIARGSGSHVIDAPYEAIVFDDPIRSWDVAISREGADLLLTLDDGTQARIADWYGANGMTPPTALRFAYDAEIGARELTAAGLEVYGSDVDDVLAGLDGYRDVISSGAGSDLIEAHGGDDYVEIDDRALVIGGPGDDWIEHWGEAAVIAYNPGDGDDTVYAAGPLTLSIGGGVAPGELALARDGADLVLDVAGAGSIRLTRAWEADPDAWPEITLQLFGSVHLYDFNAAIAAIGEPLGDVLAANEISFSETEVLGGAIAWRYATTGSIGSLSDDELRAVLADPDFALASQPIGQELSNHPPVLAQPLGDQSAVEGEAFAFALPATTFSDPDSGDTLAFGASLADGSPLPAWLAFDPASAIFSGTPGFSDAGSYQLRVSATDSSGASAAAEFALQVAEGTPPSNDPDCPPPEHDHGRSHEHPPRGRGHHVVDDWLAKLPNFDFEAIAREFERGERAEKALSSAEIRGAWERIARHTAALRFGADEFEHGAAWHGASEFLRIAPNGGHGFGFDASIGAGHAPEGFRSFEGLREGFLRL